MANIQIDVEDLIDKLEAMREDGYVTARLTIIEDDYLSEVEIEAVGIEEEADISYGSLTEVRSEF